MKINIGIKREMLISTNHIEKFTSIRPCVEMMISGVEIKNMSKTYSLLKKSTKCFFDVEVANLLISQNNISKNPSKYANEVAKDIATYVKNIELFQDELIELSCTK